MDVAINGITVAVLRRLASALWAFRRISEESVEPRMTTFAAGEEVSAGQSRASLV